MSKFGVVGILIFLLLAGCESQYFFEEDRDDTRQIVISGYINQGAGPYIVRIQQTAFTGFPPTPILNADVNLFDEAGNSERCRDDGSGRYRCTGDVVRGFPGRAYYIEVSLPDGRRYRTEPDRMPRYGASDMIQWEETQQITTTDLGIDVAIPIVNLDVQTSFVRRDDPLYLTWLGEEAYAFFPTDFPDIFNLTPPLCYIVRPIGAEDLNLFTSVGYTKNSTEVPGIITRQIDKSFKIKHIFTVYQYSMSERNYEYMKSIEALAENTGSLFDAPPGVALGNVIPLTNENENVQGFFQAVYMDTTRLAIYPSELQTRVVDDCEFVEGTTEDDYDDICKDCTLLPNSSLNRPYYWVPTF